MNYSILINSGRSFFLLKGILALLFILVNQSICVAQNHPFPVDNGIWVNNSITYYIDENMQPVITSSFDEKYCANGNDTIINSTSYKQVDRCFSSSSSFHGAWRYENGQVYFVPKDSLNEFLLYDFTLDIGDEVDVLIQEGFGASPNFQVIATYVSEVDTVIVDGTPRRRLSVPEYTWIEGIGCTSGLFMEPWINVSNYGLSLVCMSTDDTLQYDGSPLVIGEPGVCDFTVSSEELDQNPHISQIFPNPAKSQINLSNAEDIDRLSIVNIAGQEVSSIAVAKGQTQVSISVEDLSSGMFLLQAFSDQQLMTSIRFVKD